MATPSPPAAPPDAFWRLEPVDASFLQLLQTAAFLGTIWGLGRICQALKLPTSLGGLAAGILLGPEGADIVPFASPVPRTTDACLESGCRDRAVSSEPADGSLRHVLEPDRTRGARPLRRPTA